MMIEIWNNYIAPIIPYILGISVFIFMVKVITLGVDENDFMCDC